MLTVGGSDELNVPFTEFQAHDDAPAARGMKPIGHLLHDIDQYDKLTATKVVAATVEEFIPRHVVGLVDLESSGGDPVQVVPHCQICAVFGRLEPTQGQEHLVLDQLNNRKGLLDIGIASPLIRDNEADRGGKYKINHATLP